MTTPVDDEVLGMELTAEDRCDRCGAQAYMRVMLPGDARSLLLFCAHHAREHGDAVKAKGGVIVTDDTHKLRGATPA